MLGCHKGEGAQGGKDGHLQKIMPSSPLVITKSHSTPAKFTECQSFKNQYACASPYCCTSQNSYLISLIFGNKCIICEK